MRTVLICPSDRRDVPLISAQVPLATAPILGETVVEYWLSHLACAKTKHVIIAAHDRPEIIRNRVGTGARWGMEVEVLAESAELTPGRASEKYDALAVLIDHLPGLPEHPLFAGYDSWYRALLAWMPRAKTPDRVGLRELADGIWVGLHAQISPDARLEAPCWLGDHVYVGDGAVIGPGTILENGAFIEPEAVINESVVGRDTFVGRYMRIANSIAWG
jgi:NDP-sugar pyrophosphorylase family protein